MKLQARHFWILIALLAMLSFLLHIAFMKWQLSRRNKERPKKDQPPRP